MSPSAVPSEQNGGHTSATTTTPVATDRGADGSAVLHIGPLDEARFVPGHIFASRYRIVSLLGRGAMGEVYRADDLKLAQPVALKLLSVGGARSGPRVKRFMTEARLARTIAHPNVCRVYDIGEADSWWYVSMEFVDGETLESLLRRIGRLPDEKALDIARQICAGLAAAHDRGVLHRDLKPANVMVDGRGRARVLDFGLAIPSGEWKMGEIAGTPAYMAPEQIAGDQSTERTDLFALGLVLYELHVGQRLLPVRTFEERERVDFDAILATTMPAVPRAIERIIRSCLEEQPGKRPASAVALAALLPGGDPLATAVAEGIVPSPEMVAAAGPKGALHPVHGWMLLGAILIGMLALATQAGILTVMPSELPKPPAVLADRARSLLAGLGSDRVEDSAFWFAIDHSLLEPTASRQASAAPDRERTTVTFVYRQSPQRLVPRNIFRLVTNDDPPADALGTATVTLDPLGRLVSLSRVVAHDSVGAPGASINSWTALFKEAGLDEREFAAVDPGHNPPVPHDSRFAWDRSSPRRGHPHVTAATLDGRVVQFDVAGTAPAPDTSKDSLATGSRATETALWTAIVLLFMGATALARRNTRLGQGDRRGAKRLSIFVIWVAVLSGMLRAHHVPIAIEEVVFLFGIAGWAMVWGGLTWMMYVGLEPYVRRVWPRSLISWTRLLSGRLRDPLVGRDVLIGMVAGLVQVTITIVRFWINDRTAPAETLLTAVESLDSVPRFVNIVLTYQALNALIFALAGAFLLVLLRLVVRKTWIAVLVLSLPTNTLVPGGGAPFGWESPFVMAIPLIALAVFLRVGLLAYCATVFTDVLVRVPMTLDVDAWFFGHSLATLVILAALAVSAFLVSLGGRPTFGGVPRTALAAQSR
jgi:serine/threonine-protein kinase